MTDEPRTGQIERSAGTALFWRGVEYGADRGISLLRTLVLAWILVPDDFGILATATVSLDVLLTITNVGIEKALIHLDRPTEDDYHRLWTARVARAALVATVAIVAAPLFAGLFGEPEAAGVLRLLALRPLVSAAVSPREIDYRRTLDYRPLVGLAFVRSITDTMVAVALAPSLGVWAIVWGQVLGALARLIASYVLVPMVPRLRWPHRAHVITRFARWLFIAALVGTSGDFILQAIVSNRLGTEDLGRFFFALRLGMFVSVAATGVVGDVGLSVLSAQQRDDANSLRSMRSMGLFMMVLVAPIGAALVVVAEPATTSLLSSEWSGTAATLAIIAVASVPAAFADVVYPLLYARGRPAAVAVILITRTVVLLPAAYVLTGRWGLVGAAWAVLAAELVVIVVGFVLAGFELRSTSRTVLPPAVGVLIAAACGGAAGYATTMSLAGWASTIVGALTCLVVTGLVFAVMAGRLRLHVRESIENLFPSVAQH